MTHPTTSSSLGFGIGTKNKSGQWLEVYYPCPLTGLDSAALQAVAPLLGSLDTNQTVELNPAQSNQLAQALSGVKAAKELVSLIGDLEAGSQNLVLVLSLHDQEPQDVPQIYLNLQLLSRRQVKPHQINLTGIFGKLTNLAWTNQGPVELDQLDAKRLAARQQGETLVVRLVDKFPPMTDYVVPSGVRIGDATRIRLGAYLGEGTTVMHEGFVNFNAGTMGESMVEGRISAGVVIGKGSDLGGGCSTMGTLSGGGNVIISVGEKCLIGANAGVGIALGDRCTVEAGLYVTASSKVNLLDDQGEVAVQVKAMELSGKSDLLFRRNSLTGAMECLSNKTAIALNAELHAN